MPGPCAGVQPLSDKGQPIKTNVDAVRSAHRKCPQREACNGQGCRARRDPDWRERHKAATKGAETRNAMQRIAAATH